MGPRRRGLFPKYVLIITTLLSGGVLASGLSQAYFSFNESQAALIRLQQEQARGAAARIDEFLDRLSDGLRWAGRVPDGESPDLLEQRKSAFSGLLSLIPEMREVRYLDPVGTERLHASRTGATVIGSQADFSRDPGFLAARTGQLYFGEVVFRGGSEPYISAFGPVAGTAGGVTAAEIDLRFAGEVVAAIGDGSADKAYVVDAKGILIAHPNLSHVLRQTSLAELPQVGAAIRRGARSQDDDSPGIISRDQSGQAVFSSHETIRRTGWTIFVEQPRDVAFRPLYASLLRTGILLGLGLLLSFVVSVILARAMVRPIHSLQVGAVRIGSGQLDHRIDIHTGDELEELATAFNRMAAHLQETYASLEQRVQERTSELAAAIEELEDKSFQLEIASRHKSEFLAHMSHELRTPLNAVIGFSQVLSKELFGPLADKQKEYIQDIEASGQLLLSLVNDILDLSKVEAGQVEIQPSQFSLRDALETGLSMVRERAARQSIQLILAQDSDLDLIDGDERKIKQVVFNLVSNAVKFTPSGGHVRVTARALDSEVEVAVQDDGPGIPPDEQAMIFEPFYQATGGLAIAPEGTGLGLALARTFVELHGGRIWVESTLGVGSRFAFTIPRRVDGRPDVPHAQKPAAKATR